MDNIKTALDAAQAGAVNEALITGYNAGDSSPAIVVPEGYELVSLEAQLTKPSRKSGGGTFEELACFVAYCKDHMTSDSRCFAALENCQACAVINHSEAGTTVGGWGDHQAIFAPPLDRDWVAWVAFNDKLMPQADFAQFLEDMISTIAMPDGADLIECARMLQASNGVAFESGADLTSGSRVFKFAEQVKATILKGSTHISVPAGFVLKLPVFRNGAMVELKAALRYRIGPGGLVLGYHLHRPDQVRDTVFREVLSEFTKGTEMPVLMGKFKAGRASL